MIYLEDAFMDHPKMVAAGDEGILMWLRGVQWLKEQRSQDGRIPKAVVHRHCVPVIKGKPLPSEAIMRQLIEAGSWHDEGDSVVVHGYTERNEASIRRSVAGRQNAEKRWRGRGTADAIPMPRHANGNARPTGVADAYSPQSTVHVEDSSSSHLSVAADAPEEEAATPTEQAAALHAENAHRTRPEGPAKQPRKWKAAVAEAWLTEHANACGSYLHEHADLTAAELLAKIDGPRTLPGYRTQPPVVHPEIDEAERKASAATRAAIRASLPTNREQAS